MKKTKKLKKIKRTAKYWICSDCADKKKLIPPQWAVTGIFGYCGWCDSPVNDMLIPVCDYSVPGGRKAVWD